MRIVFDATSLCRSLTGIEYYAFNLLKNLLRFDDHNKYVILFRSQVHPELEEFRRKVEFIVCPSPSQIYCEQIWIPQMLQKIRPDVTHFPAFPPGFFVSSKHIMTIHDATMWKYPNMTSWKNKLYMKPLTELALIRATKIITVSEASREDISYYTKIPKERIVNTYESINECFRILENKEELRKGKGFPERFILSVGSLEPRKNLNTLLEAYAVLKKHYGWFHKLVLIGRKAWGNSLIAKRIVELGLANDIVMTGYISEGDLVTFYNLADLFIYPSLYEGFGLPPLEAMACGTPVVTSNVSSLPEVTGGAALLVDSINREALVEGISVLLTDGRLRQKLVTRGLEQVKKFTWAKTVSRTLSVYEDFNVHDNTPLFS